MIFPDLEKVIITSHGLWEAGIRSLGIHHPAETLLIQSEGEIWNVPTFPRRLGVDASLIASTVVIETFVNVCTSDLVFPEIESAPT